MMEVIDFYWRKELDKTLIINNVTGEYEEIITGQLYNILSKYALIYDILILKSGYHINQIEGEIEPTTEGNSLDYFALVKLYSKEAAKQIFQSKIFFNGHLLRIKYSYKQDVNPPKILYYKKCFELANHYLGFNGWSLTILKFEELKCQGEQVDENLLRLNYMCKIRLKFSYMSKECDGVGRNSEAYSSDVPQTKSVAFIKCKKLAYTNAVENAFSKVLLVVLENGKVHLEINESSTTEENGPENYLSVNMAETYPNSDEDDVDLNNILKAFDQETQLTPK